MPAIGDGLPSVVTLAAAAPFFPLGIRMAESFDSALLGILLILTVLGPLTVVSMRTCARHETAWQVGRQRIAAPLADDPHVRHHMRTTR